MRTLSGQDASFLYLETPTQHMHTVGTTIVDPTTAVGGFSIERLQRSIEARLHLLPPFRQRLLPVPFGLGHYVMVDHTDFDIENHIHHIAVPQPGTMKELAKIVGHVASIPLDRAQPLWEMWYVEGLEDGRVALLTKMHHCVIDGASGANLMANLMDLSADQGDPEPEPWAPRPLPSAAEVLAEAGTLDFLNPLELGRIVYDTVDGLLSMRRERIETAIRYRREPPPFLETAPKTRFTAPLTAHRSVAFASAELEEVKRIKRAFGATVNDIVLAACTISLRRYLEAQDDLPNKGLICTVPVSVKGDDDATEFNNKISNLVVRLPVHIEDPQEVVHTLREQTKDAKRIMGAIEANLMQDWMNFMAPALFALAMRRYSASAASPNNASKNNLVISNLPGPPIELYMAGARIEAVYPMGPLLEGSGLNITVLSNMGRLDIGVIGCRETVPDITQIAEGFGEAVAILGRALPH